MKITDYNRLDSAAAVLIDKARHDNPGWWKMFVQSVSVDSDSDRGLYKFALDLVDDSDEQMFNAVFRRLMIKTGAIRQAQLMQRIDSGLEEVRTL